MKKLILLSLSLLAITIAYSQGKQAQVDNVQGLDVFILNQPVAKYKVVVRMKTFSMANLNVGTIATQGADRESASEKVNKYVNQILRQAEKDSIEVDAMIYSGGKSAIGIVYTEDENQGVATVRQMYGLDIYAFCQPLTAYDYVQTKRAMSGYMGSSATYGVLDSSIEENVEKLAKRLKRKKKKHGTTGVLYNSGKKGGGIKYME